MSMLTPELLRELVAEARLAPSVRNIQPTRWQLSADGRVELIDDTTVRAPAADPASHDVRVSHGAALEGMSLALNRRSLSVSEVKISEQPQSQRYISVCTLAIGNADATDSLLASVPRRMSWRGTFASSPDDDDALERVAAAHDDIVCISDRRAIADIAAWADQAELSFLRDERYRRELLRWMRLSPGHPRYPCDGLNREALAMNGVEATGARVVLVITRPSIGSASRPLWCPIAPRPPRLLVSFCSVGLGAKTP